MDFSETRRHQEDKHLAGAVEYHRGEKIAKLIIFELNLAIS